MTRWGLGVVIGCGALAAFASAGPSFDCGVSGLGSVQETICGDEDLSTLDRRMAEVYAAATALATEEHPPVLRAEQRGWIKGRDECWKSDDLRRCVVDAYRLRIAELEARYRLVEGHGPTTFACEGEDAGEVIMTFFATDPPSAIAERGDTVSMMFAEPDEGGRLYRGRNESFREQDGVAIVVWGFGAPELHCRRLP